MRKFSASSVVGVVSATIRGFLSFADLQGQGQNLVFRKSSTQLTIDLGKAPLMRITLITAALTMAISSSVAQASSLFERMHAEYRAIKGPITLVFAPGYKVAVDNEEIALLGTDLCPPAVTGQVFILGGGYSYPGQGERACTVIEPATEEVLVRHLVKGRLVLETWSVERDGDQIRLWSADGNPVTLANQ